MIKNLNINNYYFHSIIHGVNEGLKVIDNIVKTGAIKSPHSLGVKARFGCHNESDICLSHLTKTKMIPGTISCFDIYVSRLTSFVVDKKISQKCRIYKPKVTTTEEIFFNMSDNKTNLYDEYRTKDDIPIEYIKGLCVPYNSLVKDPLIFVPFVVEELLMGYYNGYLDGETRELILTKEATKEAYNRRVDILNNYIGKIEEIFNSCHIDMPIYYYESSSNPKLILR